MCWINSTRSASPWDIDRAARRWRHRRGWSTGLPTASRYTRNCPGGSNRLSASPNTQSCPSMRGATSSACRRSSARRWTSSLLARNAIRPSFSDIRSTAEQLSRGGFMSARMLRRRFRAGLVAELRVVWPILVGMLTLIVALGLVVGDLEGWSVPDSVYFSFVTGLTIGYGDLVPKTALARILATCIGATGILVIALMSGVAATALEAAREDRT